MKADEPDPRERGFDPAGTRPKHDPASLRPLRPDDALWAPPGEAAAGEAAAGSTALPPAEPSPATPPVAHEGPPAVAALDELPASRFSSRFRVIEGVLAALAVAAVVGVGAIAIGGGDDGGSADARVVGVPWSDWAPTPGGDAAPIQIADHFGPRYRNEGKQLVVVEASVMEYDGQPLATLRRTVDGNLSIDRGGGLIYRLVGDGQGGSIGEGKPSMQRALLMRRLALELALYSFHYVDGVEQVMVVLPSVVDKAKRTVQKGYVIHVRKPELGSALDRPVIRTLTPEAPNVASVAQATDSRYVAAVTARGTFTAQFDATQPLLVLDTPTATATSGTTPTGTTGASGAATTANPLDPTGKGP